MASLKGPQKPDRLRQVDAEDHQGDADGGRVQAAPRAERRRKRRAPTPTSVEDRADQSGGRFGDGQGASAARRHRRRARPICSSSARASAAFAAHSIRRSCAWRAKRRTALAAEGKTVKILCVGKKGYDQLRRTHERQILELIDLRAVRNDRLSTRRKPIADKVIELFEAGEFDVCTFFFSRFRSVISQIPTAQQLIPPELGREGRERRRLRLRAGRGRDPDRASAACGGGAHLSGAA